MKGHNTFDISDYGAQNNPGWRVRWGSEGSNAVLLTKLGTKKIGTEWKLIWCEATPKVTLEYDAETNSEQRFKAVPPEGYEIKEKTIIISSPASSSTLPKILRRAMSEHRKGIPAPRRMSKVPYINKNEAALLERSFFTVLVAPYLSTHTIYSVDKSGTRLCNRIGVKPDATIQVRHYSSDTFQNDTGIKVNVPIINNDAPALIIDDMVSSGHTAAAIIKAFHNAGIDRMRYVTLFDVVASRENSDVDSFIESLKPVSNFYWMYGRGMDLFGEASRNTQHIFGADKCYIDLDTKEDWDDLFNFFDK